MWHDLINLEKIPFETRFLVKTTSRYQMLHFCVTQSSLKRDKLSDNHHMQKHRCKIWVDLNIHSLDFFLYDLTLAFTVWTFKNVICNLFFWMAFISSLKYGLWFIVGSLRCSWHSFTNSWIYKSTKKLLLILGSFYICKISVLGLDFSIAANQNLIIIIFGKQLVYLWICELVKTCQVLKIYPH